MGKRLKKTRKFLKKNTVFFETIASVLLSIMAIIVALNANSLSKKQAEIEYASNLPEFEIISNYDLNKYANLNYNGVKIKTLDDISFGIKHTRGIAKNIDVETCTILNIETYNNNNTNNHVFYFFDNLSNVKVDNSSEYVLLFNNILEKHELRDSKYNVYLEELLSDEYLNLRKKSCELINSHITNYERIIYFKIDYINFLNERKSEYFHYTINEDPMSKIRTLKRRKRATLINNVNKKDKVIAHFNLKNQLFKNQNINLSSVEQLKLCSKNNSSCNVSHIKNNFIK